MVEGGLRVEESVVVIPVMRPLLPASRQLLPYLSRIDDARVYSNFGPLTRQFEARLATHFGAGADSSTVTTVANATLALTLTLLAQDVKAGALCVLPAWTFVASAEAVVAAGLVPYFVDVDRDTWALEPHAMPEIIARAPAKVGAVMPVLPFGRPIDFRAWDAFHASSGLPVVIDAAAGFDTLIPTTVPAVMSLHATKAFGVGEGAFVLSLAPELVRAVRTRANFGFDGERDATVHAINAKLSEYHAAVGHAALDEWPTARSEWFRSATLYRDRLAPCRHARLQEGFGQSWISSVCVIELADQANTIVADRLQRAGIETRYWWSNGAHAHQSTRHFPRAPVPVTEQLARTTIAVPFYRDMTGEDVGRVISGVCSKHLAEGAPEALA
jgi:dTDP-4-amino-4,6-dideoxygalactose transaminase